MLIHDNDDMIIGSQRLAESRKTDGRFQRSPDRGRHIGNCRRDRRTPDANKIAFRNLDMDLLQTAGSGNSHKWSVASDQWPVIRLILPLATGH